MRSDERKWKKEGRQEDKEDGNRAGVPRSSMLPVADRRVKWEFLNSAAGIRQPVVGREGFLRAFGCQLPVLCWNGWVSVAGDQ